MDEQTKQSLLAKREEAQRKFKQVEADLYFIQGYLQLIEELLEQKDALTMDELKDALGAQSVEVVENERDNA